jgi:hypothetical protein
MLRTLCLCASARNLSAFLLSLFFHSSAIVRPWNLLDIPLGRHLVSQTAKKAGNDHL